MKNLEDINILVVGDIMLDRYVYGDVDRISPEAPVPIVKVTKEYYSLGGCGNVVRNVRELGANVACVASVANDVAGSLVREELSRLGVESELITRSVVTTEKTRIVANTGSAQLLRVDKEETDYIKSDEVVVDNIYDVIVVSDYAKGMITAELMSKLKSVGGPIIVDPKPANMHLYNDVLMITPNRKEYDEICMSSEHPFSKNIRYVLRTLGKEGMELMDKEQIVSIPSIPVNVYNVIGAGDTVVSIMATCIAIGIDVERAANISNECARYVVTQPGTSVVPRELFFRIVGGN